MHVYRGSGGRVTVKIERVGLGVSQEFGVRCWYCTNQET